MIRRSSRELSSRAKSRDLRLKGVAGSAPFGAGRDPSHPLGMTGKTYRAPALDRGLARREARSKSVLALGAGCFFNEGGRGGGAEAMDGMAALLGTPVTDWGAGRIGALAGMPLSRSMAKASAARVAAFMPGMERGQGRWVSRCLDSFCTAHKAQWGPKA